MPDQYQYVKLPDGSYGKFRADATDAEIRGHIQNDFPDAFKSGPRQGVASRFLSSAADSSGISPILNAVRHPIDTAVSVARSVADPYDPEGAINKAVVPAVQSSVENARQAWQDARSGNRAGALSHAISAVPVVGPILDKATDQYADKDYAGEMGTLTGGAAALAPGARALVKGVGAGEALTSAADKITPDAVTKFPDTIAAKRDAFIQAKSKKYWPKNQLLTPQEVASQKFVKALNPPIRGVERIKGATDEIPTVLDHAKRNGMDIRGKLDFAKAAEGAAKEVQQHYDQNILRPHTSEQVAVPDGYGGERFGKESNRATLGQINDRVNDINKELKSNFRKSLASETSQAQASDAALNAEKQQLTGILHQKLADATGLQPEDIAAVRQSAGKLRTLGEETKLSGNQDTLSLGREETGSSFSPSKHGLAEKGIKMARGGQEIIGNRAINEALKGFEPKGPNLPQPVAPDPSAVPTTPEAAQKEFLKSNDLEQSAQEAAAARNAEAERLRAQNVASQRDLAQKEVVRSTQGEQGAQDLAAARNKFADSRRAANTTAEQAATDAQAATNKASAEAEVRKAIELQNAAREASDNRSAVAEDAREASKPESLRKPATQASEPSPTQSATPIQLPEPTPEPTPTISDEQVVAADPSRGVQPVSLPVLHPAGEVTGFDEASGLPIVKRGGSGTKPIQLPDSTEKNGTVSEPEPVEENPSGSTRSGSPPILLPAPISEIANPDPELHSFSRQRWQSLNPDGDLETAQNEAQAAGFDVEA